MGLCVTLDTHMSTRYVTSPEHGKQVPNGVGVELREPLEEVSDELDLDAIELQLEAEREAQDQL